MPGSKEPGPNARVPLECGFSCQDGENRGEQRLWRVGVKHVSPPAFTTAPRRGPTFHLTDGDTEAR